jgi:hypothetical protein
MQHEAVHLEAQRVRYERAGEVREDALQRKVANGLEDCKVLC